MTLTTSDIVVCIVIFVIVFVLGCGISYAFGVLYKKNYGEIKYIEGYFNAQDKMRNGVFIDPYNEDKNIKSIGSTSKGIWLDKGENIYSLCDAKTDKLSIRDDGTSYKLSATFTERVDPLSGYKYSYAWSIVKQILGAGKDCKSIYIEYRTDKPE